MNLREEITAEYEKWRSLRYPPSWSEEKTLPLLLLHSYAAGCLHTYIHHVKPGEALDD